jgi:hypothetical protein
VRAVFGIAVLWAGYAVGLYGFCLIRSYDISFLQLVKPNAFGTSTINPKTGGLTVTGAISNWPPNKSRDDVVFPSGATSVPVSGVGGVG